MTDFYQTGIITTLHKLGTSSLEWLELELQALARTRPVTLVLLALYSESSITKGSGFRKSTIRSGGTDLIRARTAKGGPPGWHTHT